MHSEDTLADPRAWKTLQDTTDADQLLTELSHLSGPVAISRRAALIGRAGRLTEAELLLAEAERLPLAEATLRAIQLDRAAHLPFSETIDVYQRLADLPDDFPAGHPEAQALLDFVRGQALRELGRASEARALLIGAKRGRAALGLGTAAVERAIDSLIDDPEVRLERARAHLRRAEREGNMLLANSARAEVVRVSLEAFDWVGAEQALSTAEGMGAMRESVLAGIHFFRTHRDAPLPRADDEYGALAHLFHDAEVALLHEWSLDRPAAIQMAEQVLHTVPAPEPGTNLHALARATQAAMANLIDDPVAFEHALNDATASAHPRLQVYAQLLRIEQALRRRDPELLDAAIGVASSLLRPGDDHDSLWHLAARVAPSAVKVLYRKSPQLLSPPPRIRTVGPGVTSSGLLLERHRQWLRDNPQHSVSFTWLTDFALLRSA